jgi:hypothetical protein
MPSDINRLAVPTLAKGLCVVVKPCNLRQSLLFKEIAILAVPRSPCLQNTLSMAVQAPSMAPAVPGRRVDAAVPGPRRVAIISGPTGGRRCHRYGTVLRRRLRVRSSRSRFGSSSGTPGPGVARELRATVQKPFQRRTRSHNPRGEGGGPNNRGNPNRLRRSSRRSRRSRPRGLGRTGRRGRGAQEDAVW